MKFTHNALMVKDIEKTASFYEAVCEMRRVKTYGSGVKKVCWLAPKDQELPLFVLSCGRPPESEPVMRHFGFDLETREAVDEKYKFCIEQGYQVGHVGYYGETAGYLFFVRDPDGRNVEFSAEQITSGYNEIKDGFESLLDACREATQELLKESNLVIGPNPESDKG